MASVNKVILVGNLRPRPRNPLPALAATAVANVSIATSSKRKDKNTGEMIEDTQWHRVTFFDRLAEIAGEYVKKGRPIYVEGRLKYGKFTNKDGVEQNTSTSSPPRCSCWAAVKAWAARPAAVTTTAAARRAARRRRRAAHRRRPRSDRPRRSPSSGFDDMDDDIPF